MDYEKFKRYNDFALSTVYSEPEEGNFHTTLIPKMIDKIFKPLQISLDVVILDIGCGQGTFMDEVFRLGYKNLIGITKSKEDLDACHKKNHTAYDCDMSDLFFDSDQIGFIWCRHALEHSPFPFFTLLEFNRVLELSGQVYVEVPAPACVRQHEFNSNHYSILGTHMWLSLFEKSGFKVLENRNVDIQVVVNETPVTERVLCFLLEKIIDIEANYKH